jgi:hypothetical protein
LNFQYRTSNLELSIEIKIPLNPSRNFGTGSFWMMTVFQKNDCGKGGQRERNPPESPFWMMIVVQKMIVAKGDKEDLHSGWHPLGTGCGKVKSKTSNKPVWPDGQEIRNKK